VAYPDNRSVFPLTLDHEILSASVPRLLAEDAG